MEVEQPAHDPEELEVMGGGEGLEGRCRLSEGEVGLGTHVQTSLEVGFFSLRIAWSEENGKD